MKFWRNQGVKQFFVVYCMISLVSVGVVFFQVNAEMALFLFFVFVVLALFIYLFMRKRYSELYNLHTQLERMMHSQDLLPLTQYDEGELSILTSQVDKLLKRLFEQTQYLEEGKIHLGNSLADVSHQIRTPLTSLTLLLHRSNQEGLDPEERRKLLREASIAIDHLDKLIENLLKISKLDANAIVFEPDTIAMEKLIDESLETMRIAFELKDVSIVERLEGFVFCDSVWTREALSNIIKNCLEQTPSGKSIFINTKENTLFSEIVIRDEGPGIADEDKHHIFERFYKGKTASKHSVGIGLALSKIILNQQNATIKVDSNKLPGMQGAIFTIRFYKSII